ncbi:hypothetical protein EKK58_02085 [Candidatus Dependentiae bacterium]|nr:MAG: hypothetical protein EKK58_02085 [Candidatus Dependentiae bacterium]
MPETAPVGTIDGQYQGDAVARDNCKCIFLEAVVSGKTGTGNLQVSLFHSLEPDGIFVKAWDAPAISSASATKIFSVPRTVPIGKYIKAVIDRTGDAVYQSTLVLWMNADQHIVNILPPP